MSGCGGGGGNPVDPGGLVDDPYDEPIRQAEEDLGTGLADVDDLARDLNSATFGATDDMGNAHVNFIDDLGSANNIGELFASWDDYTQAPERVVDNNIDNMAISDKWNSENGRQEYGVPIASLLAAYFAGNAVGGSVGIAGGAAGTGVAGATGSAVAGGIAGGAVGGAAAAQTNATANQRSLNSDQWGNAIGTGAAGGAINAGMGSNPYGYGISNLGQAGTSATTSGLMSAARGDEFDSQLRSAAISGASSYAGNTARDYMAKDLSMTGPLPEGQTEANRGTYKSYDTASNNAGNLARNATNLSLHTLWEDPNRLDPSKQYQDIMSDWALYRDQNNNQGANGDTLEALANTPEGMQALAMWESQQQEAASKKVKAGGSGQYGTSDPQIQQQEGLGDYLYE
jgi:hypothetical protein